MARGTLAGPGAGSRKTRRRATQSERSASTQKAVLDATLACMKQHGYAHTTLSDIEKFSKLTRGALLHHFPNKQALFAAALVHLYRLRIERFQTLIKSRKTGLRSSIEIIHNEVKEWFPLTLEFMNAMRTDRVLRTLFEAEMRNWVDPISNNYSSLLSELSSTKSPLLVQYVIGCFIRGLCLEAFVTDGPLVEQILGQFVDILETYVDAQ